MYVHLVEDFCFIEIRSGSGCSWCFAVLLLFSPHPFLHTLPPCSHLFVPSEVATPVARRFRSGTSAVVE